MRLRIALAFLLSSALPALATEAVTYKGTLGKMSIIAELAAPGDDGAFVGRYAYVSKGGDIPLHGKVAKKGGFKIDEEAPCTEALCKSADGEMLETAPIGANWTLKPQDKGEYLSGQWKDAKSGKTLDVTLERVGSRELGETTGLDGLDPYYALSDDGNGLPTADSLPYDFLKMNSPLKQGKEETLGDTSFRLDTDSRTGIAYPVMVKFPGGDADKANAYLSRLRLLASLNSFSCLSKAYLGFGWFGSDGEGGTGYSDGLSVTVNLLTPKLIGITESASYWCGGAHPDNFSNYRLGDLTTGEPIVAETFLKDWVARDFDGKIVDPSTIADKTSITWGPGDALIDYVNKTRKPEDASFDAECGVNDLVRSNLGVYFTQTEMIFTLKDLPHVIFACTSDLVKIPLKDARPFLTDEGAKTLGLL
jgi:hypothetical protein